MRIRQSIPFTLTLAVLLLLSISPFSQWPASSPLRDSASALSARQGALEDYAQLPISFEANQGQADSQVRFLAHGLDYSLLLTPKEALLTLAADGQVSAGAGGRFSPSVGPTPSSSGAPVGMQFLNANPQPEVTGEEPLPGSVNYFLGSDPAAWHTNIPTYARVRYHQIYPGIDLVFYGNQKHLEYDFIVAPGSSASQIHLGFTGTNHLSLNAQNELLLHQSDGDIPEGAPHMYQNINGVQRQIAGHYVLQGATEVGFTLGAYDTSKPLIIDPIVLFSTYLGGLGNDLSTGVAVDSSGNIYLTGFTNSANFPLQNPLQSTFGGSSSDAFVAKMNAAGTALLYSSYLGGNGDDRGYGIAVDSTGDAYVTGITFSTNFPTQNPLQPSPGGGGDDAFVAKMNAGGTALVYSTYLGGSYADWGTSIAVDATGDAYITGGTGSTNFPTQNPLQSTKGGTSNSFITELNAAGSAMIYSTYLGGSNYDYANGIAVDGAGGAYVTGITHSTNFPTHNPIQASSAGSADAFVVAIRPGGSALVYATYLGGSGNDSGLGIALDSAGNVHIAGSTSSTNFPTRNALQSGNGGGADAFVAEINAAGSALVYATYLGGSGNDSGLGIALDSAGNVYITGSTSSTNFPTRNALQSGNGGGADAFVAEVNAAGSALMYSSYLGGSGNDSSNGIAVDKAGSAYVAGATASFNFPTFNPTQIYSGMEDGFLAKIAPIPAQIQVSPSVISLTTMPGVSPGPQSVTLSNTGEVPLNWVASSLPSWVSVNPSSGTLLGGKTQTLVLTFNTPGTTPQVYTTNLVLTDPNAGNSPFSLPIIVASANVSKTWYFAEGYTGSSFAEYLTLENPNATPTNATVQYFLGSGSPITKTYALNANSRTTIYVKNEVGANQNVSMTVTADQPIIAERPMYFTYTALPGYTIPGGTDVLGATSLSQQFDFGYLDTTPGHDPYLTFLNPNGTAMHATIQYFAAGGGVPTTTQHTFAANSRGTINVRTDEGLAAGTYSALVSLDGPGLVERPLYLKDSVTGYTGSADVVGVASPQTNWYFAEGYTNTNFSERYYLSNPNTSQSASATVTFFLSNGTTQSKSVSIPAGGQVVVDANSILGQNVNNSAHVSASLPILAERFMSFDYTAAIGGNNSPSIPGATDVLGTGAPSNLFYFAEGYDGTGFAEYLTIENPSTTQTATVTVVFYPDTASTPTVKTYTIAPSSRFTLFTADVLPNAAFSMQVASNVAIVAERPMYFNYLNSGQTGGSDVVGYQP